MRNRILDHLGHRRGHDAVSRPSGIETRVVQIEAVPHQEADPHSDDLRVHRKLKKTHGAALAQAVADLVEKVARNLALEPVGMRRRGGLETGAQGVQFQKPIQPPSQFGRLFDHLQFEIMVVALERVVAMAERFANIAFEAPPKLFPRRRHVEQVVR
jgi:hypothetical protein